MKSEFAELADAYLDGTLTAAQMQRLNALLNKDAEARRELMELLNVDSALAAMAADWAMERPTAAAKATWHPSIQSRWLWTTAAAACLTLAALVWMWPRQPAVFATVQEAAGVTEMREGMPCHQERHHITAGSVALISAQGARLVIEAPAEFHFESAQRLHLRYGRLAAEVPPSAKGFTVITPTGDAVDLGTRFGVDVPTSGAAEVHVFQGEVIAQASGAAARQSLRSGEAIQFNAGTGTTRELRSSAFIQPDELPGLTAGLAAGQRTQSDSAVSALRQDPALIALLDFESAESRPGRYRRVQGRWPGSQAAEFVHEGDHLKLDVGGTRDWPQLTLAAWVRIDRLGAPYQSLLHTDGWNRLNPGQVHWMINRDTTMRLALIGNRLAPQADQRSGEADSLTAVLPEQGRWVHLSTVYDSSRRRVRFYLNGRFDSETPLQTAHPARLGPAQIGNWNQQDRKLSGRIDELLLLGRAMSDAEIEALHAAGNPYR